MSTVNFIEAMETLKSMFPELDTVTVRDVAFSIPLFCSFVTQRRRTPGYKKTASPILPTPATCRARRWL